MHASWPTRCKKENRTNAFNHWNIKPSKNGCWRDKYGCQGPNIDGRELWKRPTNSSNLRKANSSAFKTWNISDRCENNYAEERYSLFHWKKREEEKLRWSFEPKFSTCGPPIGPKPLMQSATREWNVFSDFKLQCYVLNDVQWKIPQSAF